MANKTGTYAGFGLILFITGYLYCLILRYGINSFDYPVIGIFAAIFMPALAMLYYVFFMRKQNK